MTPDRSPGAGEFSFEDEFALRLPEWAQRAVADTDWRPLAEHVMRECVDTVFPDNRTDETFLEAMRGSVHENVEALRDVLSGRLRIEDVPLSARLRFAALEAEARVPQASLQRSYRISFFLQWQEWARVVQKALVDHDAGREETVAAMGSLSTIVDAYSDSVISNVAATFARSEDAFNRSRAHVRQRLVRDLLDGREDRLSPADLLTLDYALNGSHVAIVLPRAAQPQAQRLLAALRASVRPTHGLVYQLGLTSAVMWLASTSVWSEDRIERVVEVLRSSGVVACLSDPAWGTAGFVSTYEQALSVAEVGLADGSQPQVVRHADVRLEILLMQNRELADAFVRKELGPLADMTVEAAKLRSTLEASFRLGSHVATAEHLELHEHTVRNRLQRATELLGPLPGRRTELQVALRLWRIINAGKPDPAGRGSDQS